MSAVRPPAERTTVAIVGAGPVGLIAAIELARQGLKPVLLDAKDAIAWSSRATCISRRSLEIIERIGAGAAFAAKALPWFRGRSFYRDHLVFRLEMPHAPGDRHAPFVNIQQFYTEQFLLDALKAAPDSDIRWRHRVIAAQQDEAGVTLGIAAPDGERALHAEWVVAADGGRSTLRELFGLALSGTSYEGRYLITDVEVDGAEWPVERHVWFDPPSNPGSTVILHVQPDGVWRIDCQLRDGEDAEEALSEKSAVARVQAQLDMMGVRAPWRMIWKSLYRAHCLSLGNYRHGRVLFAGDAAHLVPIFGVRGLNSGIDDAHNLGWKLAMVARGEAPIALLDSYSHERLRAAHENIANATKSTWFMSPPGAGFRLLRDAVLTLAAEHDWASALVDPRQTSAHVYDDSPVVVADAGASDAGVQVGRPLPNAPIGIVTEGGGEAIGHLHTALPPLGFALLIFVEALDRKRIAELLAALAIKALPLAPVFIGSERELAAIGDGAAIRRIVDCEGALFQRFAAREFPLYLVRPDEHVAARLRTADAEDVAAAVELALARRTQSRAAVEPQATPPAAPADGRAGALGREGLERVFEAISQGVDAAGDAAAPRFLARLTLLLAEAVGEPDQVLALIAEAAQEST